MLRHRGVCVLPQFILGSPIAWPDRKSSQEKDLLVLGHREKNLDREMLHLDVLAPIGLDVPLAFAFSIYV